MYPQRDGMADRSYLSPDGTWAVVVEMDNGPWVPCRLVSMDGRSPDRQVGPPNGGCTFAAWSPNGKWIYLSSSAGGAFHIWRQRFPRGEPEQLTSGPTEEEGIAVAPDGQSFVTAVASKQSAVWIHRPGGDRSISLEGFAFDPVFTPDGKKLLYRNLHGPSLLDASELLATDLESGLTEPLFTEVPISGGPSSTYDVSTDGRRVVVLGGMERSASSGLFRWTGVPRLKPFLTSTDSWVPPDSSRAANCFEIGIRTAPLCCSGRRHGSAAATRPANSDDQGPLSDGRWLVVLDVTKDEVSGFDGRSIVAGSLTGAADLRLISSVASGELTESVLKWSQDGRILSVVPAAQHRGQSSQDVFVSADGGSDVPGDPARRFPIGRRNGPGAWSHDV